MSNDGDEIAEEKEEYIEALNSDMRKATEKLENIAKIKSYLTKFYEEVNKEF